MLAGETSIRSSGGARNFIESGQKIESEILVCARESIEFAQFFILF